MNDSKLQLIDMLLDGELPHSERHALLRQLESDSECLGVVLSIRSLLGDHIPLFDPASKARPVRC